MDDMNRETLSCDDIRVRLATSADSDAFVRFNRAMAMETENKKLDEAVVAPGVRAVFEDSTRGFYVVAQNTRSSIDESANDDADDIVAALMVTFEWSDWRNATFWWIQSVYVRPDFRRRGLYRRLYNFVREHARSAGNVCGFRLYVEKSNRAAQQVYESLGMLGSDYLMYEETTES